MDIFLIRHGEAAASWGQSKDPGLSDLGRQQAQTAAQELLPLLSSDVVLYSSPLARARETAEPFVSALDVSVVIDEVFREIPSPVALAERQVWLRGFMQQHWEEQPAQLHAWRDAAFQAILSFQQPAVVFTHFLVINAMVGRIENFPATCVFYPDNGSITHLRRHGDDLRVVARGREMETLVN